MRPLIGTGWRGHTFPGATAPFGLVQLSPDTFNDGWTNGELNRRDTANPFPGSDPRFARPPR